MVFAAEEAIDGGFVLCPDMTPSGWLPSKDAREYTEGPGLHMTLPGFTNGKTYGLR